MGRMETFIADGYHGGNHSRLTPPVLCLFFHFWFVFVVFTNPTLPFVVALLTQPTGHLKTNQ